MKNAIFLTSIFLIGNSATVFAQDAVHKAIEREDFDTAIKLTTDEIGAPSVTDQVKNEARYERAMAQYGKGDFQAAIDDLTYLISAHAGTKTGNVGSNASLHYYRGASYQRLGKDDEAIPDLKAAIYYLPSDPAAYYRLGNAYYSKHQADDAIENFSQAIHYKPDFAAAYVQRGENYQNKNQFDKAIADFSEAIRLQPTYLMAYNDRGSAKEHLQQYDGALVDLNKAIQLSPSDPHAYDNRGWVFLDKKEYQNAIADFEKGLSLTKDPSVIADINEGLGKAKALH